MPDFDHDEITAFEVDHITLEFLGEDQVHPHPFFSPRWQVAVETLAFCHKDIPFQGSTYWAGCHFDSPFDGLRLANFRGRPVTCQWNGICINPSRFVPRQ